MDLLKKLREKLGKLEERTKELRAILLERMLTDEEVEEVDRLMAQDAQTRDAIAAEEKRLADEKARKERDAGNYLVGPGGLGDGELDVDAELRGDGTGRQAAGGTGGRITDVRDREAERPFFCLGEQLQAIKRSCDAQRDGRDFRDKRLLRIHETWERENRAASGAASDVGSDGGFLIQHDFSTMLFDAMNQQSIFRSRCTVIPVGPNSNGVMLVLKDETSRATGSRWGGVRVYWVAEADTVTATKPKVHRQMFELQKLMGLFYATSESLSDAVQLTRIAEIAFPQEMAWMLDEAIVNGSGTGQPLGVMNCDALITVAKETNQTADTIVAENVSKMYNRIPGAYRNKAAWYHNQDCEPTLEAMAIAVGTGGVPVFLPAGGYSSAPYNRLKGKEMMPTEHQATVGDKGDILFADMSQYLLIEKSGIKGDRSIHVRFLYDEEAFRWTYRVNGQPLWRSAVTAAKGTQTYSPFVTLAARA